MGAGTRSWPPPLSAETPIMIGKLRHSTCSKSRGTTLVELLVASVCLGIGISGVMTMIGSGRQEESANFVRNQARIAAISKLESDALHYSKFTAIPLGAHAPTNINLYTEANVAVPAVIDSRADNVGIDWANTNNTRLPIDYKLVYVKVSWNLAGRPDSVYYLKRVTDIK